MVFSSIYFLIYFLPAFLLLYSILPKALKNIFLLLVSIFFYSWGGPKFIFAILGTSFIDFFLVQQMDKSKTESRRKLLLVLSICLNVGMLFYFKYCNFFIDNVNLVLHTLGVHEISLTKIILPIGISFYTFETLTYVIDVYRRVHKPLKNLWDYQLYILLFPKLIAGPIIPYHDISDQLTNRYNNETAQNRLSGFFRFCIGLGKKVLIANCMGQQADAIFSLPLHDINTSVAWIGALAYTFQIYFDFSGYSDMAIGLGKIMGFTFPENFNNPYTAISITDFWRKWHITLGSWMRNYLYIPLGGNKVDSKFRLYFNLWLVFLLSGLWHGASWTFLVWGIYHGLFLVLERSFLLKHFLSKIGKIPSIAFTFIVVVVGWVFFRSENIGYATSFAAKMFSFHFSLAGQNPFIINNNFTVLVVVAAFFSFFTIPKMGLQLQDKFFNASPKPLAYFGLTLLSMALFILSISSIMGSDFNPFIYFRF